MCFLSLQSHLVSGFLSHQFEGKDFFFRSVTLKNGAFFRYYNCGETGVTEYNHSTVIAALQGALDDGVVNPEDIMPVHNFLAPIKVRTMALYF